MICLAVTYTWLCWLTMVRAARILAILPYTGTSHFSYNMAILSTLHDAGHHVTLISPFANLVSLPNVTVIDSNRNDTMHHNSTFLISEKLLVNIQRTIQFLRKNGVKSCNDVLSLKKIQEDYHSKMKLYDVMFIQLLSMYHCYLPLAQKLDIPVIGSTVARVWRLSDLAMGNPFNPAVSRFEYGDFSTTWSFTDRLSNFWRMMKLDFFYSLLVPSEINSIYQKYYSPELMNKQEVSLLFVNSHDSFFPRPMMPNIIEIGGIHIKPANPLPKTLEKLINDAEYGVIVFSLGALTKSSSISDEMLKAFRNAFSGIPQLVIWKYEDLIEDAPHNLITLKWLPQRDILAHKNVKAFISHCGVSGTYEAIYEAVPMIMTPIFGDQKSNAALLHEKGVGIYLDISSVNENEVLNALDAVINDTRYAINMQELSKKFKNRPISPRENVVYWTEYVVRQKGVPHLKYEYTSANVPLYQYLLLDVIVFILSVLLTCFGIIFIGNILFQRNERSVFLKCRKFT